MSNITLFNLISQPYVGSQEIKTIAQVGINKANEIRKQIKEKYCQNMLLPRNKIPTKYLLEELKIKPNDIHKLAKMEKELQHE